MRAFSLLLQCCVLLGAASAQDAYLYTFDDDRQSQKEPTPISSNTASILLTRRHGLDDLTLHGVGEDTLRLLCQYGGYQQPLFSDETIKDPSRAFVRILGHHIEPKLARQLGPRFTIMKPSTELLEDVAWRPHVNGEDSELCRNKIVSEEGVKFSYTTHSKARRPVEEVCCPDVNDPQIPCGVQKAILSKLNGQTTSDILTFSKYGLYEQVLDPAFAFAGIDADFSQAKLSDGFYRGQLAVFIGHLQEYASTHGVQPTLLLLPSPSHHTISTRQTPEEEPLDLDFASAITTSTSSLFNNIASNISYSKLPACFSSQSACENATAFCSGHGSCSRSGKSTSCYKCQCARTTVRTNKDGSKKTVQWAGVACQKKDISVEFWLFASLGIFMTSLIAGAIGMLMSMGSEELPSVIGAGVGGPTASK